MSQYSDECSRAPGPLRFVFFIVLTGFSLFCRSNKEGFLRNLCRDNTQLLINKLWEVKYYSISFCCQLLSFIYVLMWPGFFLELLPFAYFEH